MVGENLWTVELHAKVEERTNRETRVSCINASVFNSNTKTELLGVVNRDAVQTHLSEHHLPPRSNSFNLNDSGLVLQHLSTSKYNENLDGT